MRKLIRISNVGLLAAIFAVGGTAAFAQDPCTDADSQTKLGDQFRAEFADKTIPGRKKAISTGKSFLEKFGTCESTKELTAYLNTQLPKMEEAVKKMEDAEAEKKLIDRFNAALTAKNWDEVYVTGKEALQKYGEKYRDAELVLGSIGLDETAKTPSVVKWNDQTLQFAKQAIAGLESGKAYPSFGVAPFKYKSKEDALGWMNYTIGYIYFFDKKDKKQGLSFLYKASQAASDTKNNPVIYQSIGSYYFDEVRRLAAEVTELEKKQDPAATEEAQKALVDQIKAKVALVNGNAEAAIDAYARALTAAKTAPDRYKKDYTDSLTKTMQDLYNVRFGKMDGFDTFVANIVKKPMPNPSNPVAPIADPDTTTTNTSTTGTNGSVAATAPAAGAKAAPAKPAPTGIKPKN